VYLKRSCEATAASGRGCEAAPLREGNYCFWHSPEHAQEAADSRRLGGLRRRREATVGGAYEFDGLGGIELARRLLSVVITDTLSLDNSIQRSRVLVQIVTALLRVTEVTEQERRLEELEIALSKRRGKG